MTPSFNAETSEYDVLIGYDGVDVYVTPTDSRALVNFSVKWGNTVIPIDPSAIRGRHLHLDGQVAHTIDGYTGVTAPYTITVCAEDGVEQGPAYTFNVAYYGPEDG